MLKSLPHVLLEIFCSNFLSLIQILDPCGSIESLQLHRRESKTGSVAFTLSPEDNQAHKELVNIKSNFFVEQPYKELVILNSRYKNVQIIIREHGF